MRTKIYRNQLGLVSKYEIVQRSPISEESCESPADEQVDEVLEPEALESRIAIIVAWRVTMLD